MKRLFNRITIIGVGLIGGSVGLAVKERRIAREVTGVFRRKATLNKALKCKAVDSATLSVEDGVGDADLIILAAPVHSIPVLAAQAIKYAKAGAIITDVGSTKAWITSNIEDMIGSYKAVSFVGSHPMAGSEHAGVKFAKADLLNGAPCIVTRTGRTDRNSLNKVTKFWKSLGARVTVMSPSSHDETAALISHMPHIVAFGLAGATPQGKMRYAAEGFKDTTRVASSDPDLWADIFLTNQKQIISSARIFEKYYRAILKAIARGDYAGTVKLLKRAKDKRDRFTYAKDA